MARGRGRNAYRLLSGAFSGAVRNVAERATGLAPPRQRHPQQTADPRNPYNATRSLPNRISNAINRTGVKQELKRLSYLFNTNLRARHDRELGEIYFKVYNAIQSGEIRSTNPMEIYSHFNKWFREILEQDPSFAQKLNVQKHGSVDKAIQIEAQKATQKFLQSFDRKKRKELDYRMGNLAAYARGGDPGD
ncbi:MAG: hypothetical protein NUV57_03110 [archaeon]|nr:hypothetical protein [archaeon]